MSDMNSSSKTFLSALNSAERMKHDMLKATASSETVNIVGAGGALTAAYEQIRNAAENTDEHLLLQSAVRRFYKQLFLTNNRQVIEVSGNELAVELTLAGYMPNNSLTKGQLDEISRISIDYYQAYLSLSGRKDVNIDKVTRWMLDTLAAQATSILSPQPVDSVFANFAYSYFEKILEQHSEISNSIEHGPALYIAVHQALLKSSVGTIRTGLMDRYQITIKELDSYLEYNENVDRLIQSAEVDKMYRIVNRQGAPLRIVRRMIEDRPDFEALLPRRDEFLNAFEQQVTSEYSNITNRINRAIVRSVMFLAITKLIIGIAIEVPYDYWLYGAILWQPLIINLLFPPLYMIALRLTLSLPDHANTRALVDRADAIFYGDKVLLARGLSGSSRHSRTFSLVYGILSLAVFAGVVWILFALKFSVVHVLIFLVFVSTASFLGFRLSRLIRELEVVRSASNGFTFIRDLLYLPFVVVGRWMSDKYSKINIVTLILDMLIELPLKSVLRIVRRWSAFIDDRKDRI